MQDQRLVTRLQNYWELIKRGKPLPDITQFNPSTIEDLWERCIKLEATISQNAILYTYQYMGKKLINLFDSDLTHTNADRRIAQYPHGMIIKKMDESFASKQSVIDENQFVNGAGKIVKYRAIFLPFGNEERGITHLIVGLSDKQFG